MIYLNVYQSNDCISKDAYFGLLGNTKEKVLLFQTSTKPVPFDECLMIQETQTQRSFYS